MGREADGMDVVFVLAGGRSGDGGGKGVGSDRGR